MSEASNSKYMSFLSDLQVEWLCCGPGLDLLHMLSVLRPAATCACFSEKTVEMPEGKRNLPRLSTSWLRTYFCPHSTGQSGHMAKAITSGAEPPRPANCSEAQQGTEERVLGADSRACPPSGGTIITPISQGRNLRLAEVSPC